MRSIGNEIKRILTAVTILTALFTTTLVLAGSASALVISANPAVVHAPIGTAVSTLAVRPAINPLFRPAVNPLFRPAVNPLFRPAVNPLFRPNPFIFRPNPFAFRAQFFNPFLGVDLDDLGLGFGFGLGLGIGEVGIGAAD